MKRCETTGELAKTVKITDRRVASVIAPNKLWRTEPEAKENTICRRIEAFQRKNNILSTALAQSAYAYEKMRISIKKLGLEEKEIEELQNWLDKKSQPIIQESPQERREAKIPKVSRKIVDISDLPSNLLKEANKMARVYPDIYVLENLVRHIIMNVLRRKYGDNWWNTPNIVSNKIKIDVEGRKHFEGKNRWAAKRRAHEIFYTDSSDLSRIIATNCREFKEIFADMEIEAELRKLEPSRNVIAHNNPLSPNEFTRIKLCVDDVKKQLADYTEKRKPES